MTGTCPCCGRPRGVGGCELEGDTACMRLLSENPIAALSRILQASGLRATMDRRRSTALPCWRCETTETPRRLVAIGTYTRPVGGNILPGDEIDRPLCAPCEEATRPTSAPPAAATSAAPVWAPYDDGGYPGRRWIADDIVVSVTACAEWHVQPTDRASPTGAHGDAISVAEAERCALAARPHVLAIEQLRHAGHAQRRWHPQLATVMREILGKDPSVVNHLPGEQIMPCFMPRDAVDPRFHVLIEDLTLENWNVTMYECARKLLREFKEWFGSDLSLYDGADAVLVVGPAQ